MATTRVPSAPAVEPAATEPVVNAARRAVLLGPPLALAVLEVIHPTRPQTDPTRWVAVHVVQPLLVALLAIAA